MLNKVGRDNPNKYPALEGREVYQGEFAIEPKAHRAGKTVHMSRVGTNKVLASIDEAIEKAGVKDGMTLSFHHHLRNGDYVMKMVMERGSSKKALKTLQSRLSSLSPCHEFLVEMIQDGTVTAIETSGLRDRLGKFLTQNPGVLKTPCNHSFPRWPCSCYRMWRSSYRRSFHGCSYS